MASVIDTLITNRTSADVTSVETIVGKIKAGTASTAETNTYLTGMIGSYNHSDLNRVGQAIAYLKAEYDGLQTELYNAYNTALNDITNSVSYPLSNYDISISLPTALYEVDYSYPVATETVKTDWAKGDIPTTTQITEYLTNIKSIAVAGGSSGLVPTTLSQMTYSVANNLEQALKNAETRYIAYRQEKLNNIESAKNEAIQEFRIIDSNWWNCGETYSGGY